MRFMPGTPAYRAYHAMLDQVRANNTHLTEQELNAKLCEARDEYIRKIRDKY
jgi:histidinol dehydrogenase